MTEKANYRQHAADFVRLAQKASTAADKERLLALGEACLYLAAGFKAKRHRNRRLRIPPVNDLGESRSSPIWIWPCLARRGERHAG